MICAKFENMFLVYFFANHYKLNLFGNLSIKSWEKIHNSIIVRFEWQNYYLYAHVLLKIITYFLFNKNVKFLIEFFKYVVQKHIFFPCYVAVVHICIMHIYI